MTSRDIVPRSRPSRAWPATIAILLLLAIGSSYCSPVRTLEAARLLADIRAGMSAVGTEFDKSLNLREHISYKVAGQDYAADIYRPENEARANIILVPGLAPAGRDDPRLVAMAASLSRARFLVFVPEIASFRELKARGQDSRYVAAGLCHLGGPAEAENRNPLGVIALSYAAGPAFMALLEPGDCRRADFMLTVGGYYDLEALITFFTTGYHREPAADVWRHVQPNAYGKWVFLQSNTNHVDDLRDRRLLGEIARRKLADRGAPIDDLIFRLGSEGRAVTALLVNDDRNRVAALIAALPEAIRSDIAALDLKRQKLSGLETQVLLVHGRDDAIIPYTQSMALRAALGRESAELFLVNSLAHVDFKAAGLTDYFTLWRAIYRLLELRDAA